MAVFKGEGFRVHYESKRKHLDLILQDINPSEGFEMVNFDVIDGRNTEECSLFLGEKKSINGHPLKIQFEYLYEAKNGENSIYLKLYAPQNYRWNKIYLR